MQVNVVWVGYMKKRKDGDDYCGLKSANSRPGTASPVFSSHRLKGSLSLALSYDDNQQ